MEICIVSIKEDEVFWSGLWCARKLIRVLGFQRYGRFGFDVVFLCIVSSNL